MPTSKFFKLKKVKQKAILEAICREFLEYPYASVKVSRIAASAQISRSSFYAYFSNKEDFYGYTLYQISREWRERLIEALKQEDGNFYDGFRRILNQLFQGEYSITCFCLFHKMLVDMDCMQYIRSKEPELDVNGEFREYIHRCYEVIDKERYALQDEGDLAYMIDMGIMILKKTVGRRYIKYHEESELRLVASRQLQILDQTMVWQGRMEA